MDPTQQDDAYTIVIFRGPRAKPLRLSFPRHILRNILIIGVVLLLADIAVLSHYVVRTQEVWELQSLRSEVLSSRQQVSAFSDAFDGLKSRVLSIKEMNQRMRVMLGIEVERSDGDLLNGRGGEETPIENDAVGQGAPVVNEATQAGMLAAREQPRTTLLIPRLGASEAEAATMERGVRQEITWLLNEIWHQESATQKLMDEAEKRKDRWNATPSIWPVRGWVTSGFGPRLSPFTGRPALHDGLDIGAAQRTPVRAPAYGRVTAIGYHAKLGHIVRLDHGYGIETLYGHMAKHLVKRGQRIKRGDVIGLVGSSGLSTGPHLHYMIKVKGRAVNPRQYILE